MNRPTRSTYTYRIPLDDTAAMLRLRRFERKSEYDIRQLSDREVPNSNARQHWACVFYQSKETRGDQPDQLEGGTIPGLHEYRYSLDWEPLPEDALLTGSELIEMRYANGGGTRLKGEYHIGTHDPRLPEYAPVDMTVPWTPGEIKAMFDGEDVPNKLDYSHDPPMMDANEAREKFREMIDRYAHGEGFDSMVEELHEQMENCDHDHVVKCDSHFRPSYCEDCGMEWHEEKALETAVEEGDATIVGTAA